jgi:hypothetical protein
VRGKMVETVEYPAYCAVALAGLGDLPDTILTRSVIIRMRRRAKSEKVEPFRRRVALHEGHALHDRLAAWAADAMNRLRDVWPEMPPGVEDRDADVWEALLAVADAAGGEWPVRARTAAVALVAQSKETTPSLGIRLLADLRTVFSGRDAMTTDAVLTALHELEEAPWGELVGGKPLNARGLAKRLAGYDVKPKSVRIGAKVVRGYAREDLADAWSRYLPPEVDDAGANSGDQTHADVARGSPSPRESTTSATTTTAGSNGASASGGNRLNHGSSDHESARVEQPFLSALPFALSATSPVTVTNGTVRVADVADVADVRGGRDSVNGDLVRPTDEHPGRDDCQEFVV